MADESGLSEAAQQIIAKRAQEVAETERIIQERAAELARQQANDRR